MILADAVGRWHTGCTIKEGDRVVITNAPPMPERKKHGWWVYRECLVPGATATMTERPRFIHGRYRGLIRLDRQWSVHDKDTPRERRFFSGGEYFGGVCGFGLFLYPVDWLALVPQEGADRGAV